MEYNTTREKLIIPEYGRNVQKLIEYAMTIEDREKRNNMAHLIVHIMAQMNPHVRENSDYRRKLWDHMFFISDFKLDVDSPYPKPTADILTEKPQPLEYKGNEIKFRHYGKNVEKIIQAAIEFEEGEEKDALIQTIANHLKKSYLSWNRESVNDSMINEHLKTLSDGKLYLKEDIQLNSTSEILAKTKKKRHIKRDKRDSRDNRNNNYSNRRRRTYNNK